MQKEQVKRVNRVEDLKIRIEKERTRLNQLVIDRKAEETYRQSLLVDELVAEYIRLTNE
jgi:hypothetical protein